MSFSTFFSKIINCFNVTLSKLTSLAGIILENNFIKFIIYLTLLYIIIEFIDSIIGIILNIFSMKKASDKNKSTNNNTDIE